MAPPKGTTNNPRGRPPKSRALTGILERAGNTKLEVEGQDKAVARKQILADLVWQAVTTRCVTFPGTDAATPLPPKEWIALVQFVYSHIDGPPKAVLELGSNPDRPVVVQRRPDLAGLSDEDLIALEAILSKTADPGGP